jgi:catechol 2,3-dioxygenase-like lactoylglutathione lyase family enzyme
MNIGQTDTPVAFLYVADRDRALGFYRETLGLELRSADDFGDFIDLGGAWLRMTVMPDHKAHPHPVLGWNVGDIAVTIFEGMGQDPLGIWTAPDGKTKVAFFADPDGNVLSLSQV